MAPQLIGADMASPDASSAPAPRRRNGLLTVRRPVTPVRSALRTIQRFGAQRVRPSLLGFRIHHVSGPKRISYADDELLAISVVRNGALHIRSFLDHHLALGVKHIVILLNDSTDETMTIAAAYPNVTLLRTRSPYARYENVMKRYLARRFSRGRWNLCVDIDQLFDYPYSDRLPIKDFLRYLTASSNMAVVAQMLDMFTDLPLELLQSSVDDDVAASTSSTTYPPYGRAITGSRNWRIWT